jgi:magnesium-transporting ATPase (P-type)
MTMIVLIAIAAGCASALMFASIISKALISLLLLYFAPLPLMVAALGWGPLAATIGGIGAATVLGAIFGLPFCIAFVIMMALPAWWLGHLALLGRPSANGVPSGNGAAPAAPALEWYPVGRILLWIAAFAILSTMATLLTLGTDAATITETLRAGLLRVLNPRAAPPSDEVMQRIDAMVTIAPAAAASSAMTMLMLNLWLAARITATSGRLHRPWPDLKSTELPPMTLAALSAAIAFSFTSGLFAMLAQTVTAALLMAYALTGFAVLHTLTLGLNGRALWLACTYAVVMLSGGWLIPAMMVLGLADAVFGFRRRFLQRRPPPLPMS